jgi:hypothetical protein
MDVARPFLAVALVLAGALSACGAPDGDGPIRTAVLDCIADGGGAVGADADVAIVDGRAMSVIGEVEASDDLLASCFDRASG